MPNGTCQLHLCPAPTGPAACPKPQACREGRSFGSRGFSNQEPALRSSRPPQAAPAWAPDDVRPQPPQSSGPTWPCVLPSVFPCFLPTQTHLEMSQLEAH